MRYSIVTLFVVVTFLANGQNSFPLYSSGSYSGGSGDHTNVTTPQLKLQSTSGSYIRVPHISANSAVSAVYNFETGKHVYWGEPTDGGTYFFRGRNLEISEGSLSVKTQLLVNGVGVITNGGNDVYANIRVLRNTSTQFTDGMFLGYGGSGGPLRFFSNSGTAEFMTLATSGYLGVGATSPVSKLHVNSAIERETLRLYKNGNTTNYLSMWQGTGAAAIDPIGTGKLYLGYDMTTDVYVGGKIGIGNVDPQAKLHISNGDLLLQNHTSGYPTLWLKDVAGTNTLKLDYNSIIGAGSNLILRSGSNSIVLNDVGGNVGIGTASPTEKLTINGSGTIGAEIKTDGAASSRSVLSFHRGSSFWNIGMNMNVANTNDFHFRLNGTIYPFTIQAATGNVGIGTTNPNQKLTVNGTIYGKEVKVDLSVPGPDYVFEKDYDLPSLEEIKKYIDENKHLPEVPSAKEMEVNGIEIGKMNMLLLKKVEELTLHMIETKKEIDQLRAENKELKEIVCPKN